MNDSQPGRAPGQPDDLTNYQSGRIFAQIASVLFNGFPLAARMKKSLRVGSGSVTLAAIDGNDGQLALDGPLAGLYFRDRADSTKYVLLYNNSGFIINTSALGDAWTFNPATGFFTPVMQTPTLAGTWATLAGRTVKYWRDLHGDVHLEGQVTGGAIPSTAFTLLAGYAPITSRRNFAIDSNSAFGEVFIDTTGDVTVNVGSATAVSFDGISFRTV